ncbi:MAG: hypothetical protein PVG71_11960 [Anaerolineae bacterium]
MVVLTPDYYHCFLGNGLDAVLIGPTGSMVHDRVGVDRCNWCRADRYYPENRLVHVAGRLPMDRPLEHAEGSGWYEIAPRGYDVRYLVGVHEPWYGPQRWYQPGRHNRHLAPRSCGRPYPED